MGRLLTYVELKRDKGIRYSREHLRRLELAREFPRRVRVGANTIGWDEAEIDAHLNAKRAARDEPPPEPTRHRRFKRRAAGA